jgi:Uma2 family endonuclease
VARIAFLEALNANHAACQLPEYWLIDPVSRTLAKLFED